MTAREHAEAADLLMAGHEIAAFEGGGMAPPHDFEVERAQAHALIALALSATDPESGVVVYTREGS